jgi:hypothetical protein
VAGPAVLGKPFDRLAHAPMERAAWLPARHQRLPNERVREAEAARADRRFLV